MSQHDSIQRNEKSQQIELDGNEKEEGGMTMAPPQFFLVASASDDNRGTGNNEEGEGDDLTPIAQLAAIVEEKIRSKEIEEILPLLFQIESQEILSFWSKPVNAAKLQSFFSHLKPAHYTAFPREIAMTLQAIPAASRKTMIGEIIGKKKELKALQAAQVTFLMQGLGQNPIENAEQQTVFLKASKSFSYFGAALREDVKVDRKEEEKEGANFSTMRATRQTNIEQAESELAEIRKGWENLTILHGLRPEIAIALADKLKDLEDGVRNEIMRRHPDVISTILFNLPVQYRTSLGFGLDNARGTDEESEAFIKAELAKPETWTADALQSNRLGMMLSSIIQGGLMKNMQDLIIANLNNEVVWQDDEILQKILYILTLGMQFSPTPEVLALVQSNKNENNQAILVKAGFSENGWSKPEQNAEYEDFSVARSGFSANMERYHARRGNKQELAKAKKDARTNGETFDKSAYQEAHPMTSPNPQMIGFTGKKGTDLDLTGFSLSELQHGMSGDIMGLKFTDNADPKDFPDAGKIDAHIRDGFATIHSESLPFDSLNYEMGTSMIEFDAGFMRGVDAEFVWNPVFQNSLAESEENPKGVHSSLNIQDVLLNNFAQIGGDDALRIGKIAIQGLKVNLNNSIDANGPVTGGWGMNLILSISAEVTNILMLAINALTTTLDPMLPDADLSMGQALSEMLLNSFGANAQLNVSFDAVNVENVMSANSDIMRQISLGKSEIQIGGSLLELYENKIKAIEAKSSCDDADETKKKHYESILAQEKAKIESTDAEIKRLKDAIAALSPDAKDEQEKLKAELKTAQSQGQMLVSASINNLKLVSSIDENGAEKTFPIPGGNIDILAQLDVPTIGLDKENRAGSQVDAIAGILNDENQAGKAGLNLDAMFVEGENLLLPDKYAEVQGMDLNEIMPGWVGGEIQMQPEKWMLKVAVPQLHFDQFPQIEGVEFSAINPKESAYCDLNGSSLTVEIDWNSAEDQKANGLAPKKITVSELQSNTLTGDNLKIKGEGFDIELSKLSHLEGVYLKNLGLDFGPDFALEGLAQGEVEFGAKSMTMNKVLLQVGEEIKTNLNKFSAQSFSFKKFHSESIDPENPNRRNDIDRIGVGFEKGKGEGNKINYEGSELDFNVSSVSGSRETNSQKEKNAAGEWETQSSVTKTNVSFEVPVFNAASLHYGSDKDPFQIKGIDGAATQPATLSGIVANLTLYENFVKNRKDADGKVLPEKEIDCVYVHSLNIAKIQGQDFVVRQGGNSQTLKGPSTIEGVYMSGFEQTFGENAKMMLQGKAGFSKSEINELVMGLLHVKNTSTGAFFIGRLATNDGYEYSMKNIVGEVEKDKKGAKKDAPAEIGANVYGDGFSADGNYMDNGVITANVSIGGGTVSQLNWSDKAGKFSIVLPKEKHATMGGVSAVLEMKIRKNDTNQTLEYVKVKSFVCDYLTATGPHIRFKGNKIDVPADKSVQLLNLKASDINYNLLTDKFSGKITADQITGEAATSLKSELLQSFLSQPELDLSMFSFDMQENGDIAIKVGESSLGIPTGEKSNMTLAQQKITFGQKLKEFPLMSMEGAEILISKIDPMLDTYENNSKISARITNPKLNGLQISQSEMNADGQFEGISNMTLSGQATGTLIVTDTPTGLSFGVSQADENGNLAKGGSLIVEKGSLTVADFHKFLPDPNTKKSHGEAYDQTYSEQEVEESGPAMAQMPSSYDYGNTKPKAPSSIDEYKPTDQYAFLNSLKPADEDGGTVKIKMFGGTAEVPIQNVLASSGEKLGGYIDVNAALDQLEPQVAIIIGKLMADQIGVPKTIVTPIMAIEESKIREIASSAASMNLYAGQVGGKYVLKLGFGSLGIGLGGLSNEVILVNQLAQNGLVEQDGKSLLSLSNLVDYQAFKALLPSETPKDPKDGTPEAIMAQIMHYMGTQPFGIEMHRVKLDMKKAIADESSKQKPLENGEARPVNLGDTFNTEDQGDIGFNLKIGASPEDQIGPVLKLTDLVTPGFTKSGDLEGASFQHYTCSTSSLKLGKALAKIENLQKSETKFDLENVVLNDFQLNLAKR